MSLTRLFAEHKCSECHMPAIVQAGRVTVWHLPQCTRQPGGATWRAGVEQVRRRMRLRLA